MHISKVICLTTTFENLLFNTIRVKANVNLDIYIYIYLFVNFFIILFLMNQTCKKPETD